MISKLVKRKEKAFIKGTEYINFLKQDFYKYSSELIYSNLSNNGIDNLNEVEQKKILDKYIGLNVDDVTKYIYNNSNFNEYLKYSFLGKYYEKKIDNIRLLIILLFILVGVGIYFIFDIGLIFIISVIVLIIGLLFILRFLFKDCEKYSSYYNRTMFQFLMNVYGNIGFSIDNSEMLTEEELSNIINYSYDKKSSKNNISFTGSNCSGNILDLELTRVIETKHKDGSVTRHDDKIFDGFYLKININSVKNLLRGNIIKIRNDENILSSLAEDTVRGIYESEKEILFNSEEMNKSFDARISGYNGFSSVDDMMIQVQKILTPSFEQHLLYLRSRYNSFNMNITDSGMSVSVNMERSMFQKAKHNELLDFKRTYREANETFRMLKADVNGIDDFAYYNVFPFLERLYLINYLTYLYLSYMDFDNYYSFNNWNINNFEETMKVIYTMDNKEFREIYTDKLKNIKDNIKDLAKRFESEGE